MSRIGKKPVAVPSGVTVSVDGQTVKVKGPRASCTFVLHDDVAVKHRQTARSRSSRATRPSARARMWGTSRTLVANLVEGVTKGFEKKLEITGVGYRAAMQGKNLQLALGFSHDVDLSDPGGHHDRDAEADRNRDHRHRQAEGRPGRRRDPRVSAARALQGQGRASTPASTSSARKARRSNGARPWLRHATRSSAARRGSAARIRKAAATAAAAVGVPLVEAHLRAGHRRR